MRATTRAALVVCSRALRLSLRNPTWVLIGLTQPVLYLALFGPLLQPLAPQLGADDAWRLFVPGLLVLLALFGALFVGFGLVAELRAGVVEQMRVTPASRLALLLGRVLRDAVVLLAQAALLTAAALLFGLRAPLPGVLAALAIVVLLGTACASLSYAAALRLRNEDSLASVLNSVAVPLLLLSGILLPMELAPAWLRALSAVNPLRHIVDGARALFAGQFGADAGLAVLFTLALAAVAAVVGWRTFLRESV